MIFVKKQRTPPPVFLQAVDGLRAYDQLSGEEKKAVIQILLAEQGQLCALCERSKFGETIEHFMPRSIFPDLQLNYHNLYIACGKCNEPKGNFLIPPFIFDPRFDPCAETFSLDGHHGVRQFYEMVDDKCGVRVPAAISSAKGEAKSHNSAGWLLFYTLELMAQNRQSPSHSNLMEARGLAYKAMMKTLPTLPNEKILEQWNNIINARTRPDYRFPEFVTMQLQLLAVERRRRGI